MGIASLEIQHQRWQNDYAIDTHVTTLDAEKTTKLLDMLDTGTIAFVRDDDLQNEIGDAIAYAAEQAGWATVSGNPFYVTAYDEHGIQADRDEWTAYLIVRKARGIPADGTDEPGPDDAAMAEWQSAVLAGETVLGLVAFTEQQRG